MAPPNLSSSLPMKRPAVCFKALRGHGRGVSDDDITTQQKKKHRISDDDITTQQKKKHRMTEEQANLIREDINPFNQDKIAELLDLKPPKAGFLFINKPTMSNEESEKKIQRLEENVRMLKRENLRFHVQAWKNLLAKKREDVEELDLFH